MSEMKNLPERSWSIPELNDLDSGLKSAEEFMLNMVQGFTSPFGPEVEIDIAALGPDRSRWGLMVDFGVEVRWAGQSFEFAAEMVSSSAPRMIENTIRRTMQRASRCGGLPMIIAPYLSERNIALLEQYEVSGLDLSGNGLVIVPGRMLLKRTGQRNAYPQSQPAKFIYRGATSQVPRVFLRRPVYPSVGEIRVEIGTAGGRVAPSTVSKALARMTDDLVVERDRRSVRLLQPDKLLDLLSKNFTLPKPTRVVQAKLNGPLLEVFIRANRGARNPRVMLSGESSQSRYSAGMRADNPVLYCADLYELSERLDDACQFTDRFADITLVETRDPTPWLDARTDESGIVYASPVQTYLELSASGDKRDREIAEQVRDLIMREVDESARGGDQ